MNKKVQLVVAIIVIVALASLVILYGVNTIRRATDTIKHPTIEFELQDYGKIKMELYPEYAPNTVANILKLAQAGYYNDKVIYGKDTLCLYMGRNQDGELENPKVSMVNSKIAEEVATAEEGEIIDNYEYGIKGEFIMAGYDNTLLHEKGIVSLIRSDYTQYFSNLKEESYTSGNAQIGIMMSDDAVSLDGAYAAFGRIIEGMDILEKIYNESEAVVKEGEDTETAITEFATYPVITSVTIDTFGVDYGEPDTVKLFDYSSYVYNYMNSYYGN